MRAVILALVLFLTACALPPYRAGNDPRDPYPVEPQTVTVHFVPRSFFFEEFAYPTANGYARLHDDGRCELFFPVEPGVPSRYTLSHELRHCVEGDFH